MEEVLKASRTQSPSSILTFKQCPRKYYYRYIAKLPTGESIHLIRGSVMHKVMEDIYDIDVTKIPEETFPVTIKVILHEMLRKEWEAQQDRFAKLDMIPEQIQLYYEETKHMTNNFFQYLMDRVQEQDVPMKEAFMRIKPMREVKLHSPTREVMGYADAIMQEDDKIVILDYKTSKHAEITEDYFLQLSIYSMLYQEKHRLPDEVGIFFLKHGKEIRVPVTQSMAERADVEVRFVHEQTQSKDIRDYPKNVTPLCKWSTGQCDFYDECFGKKLMDYDGLVKIGKNS